APWQPNWRRQRRSIDPCHEESRSPYTPGTERCAYAPATIHRSTASATGNRYLVDTPDRRLPTARTIEAQLAPRRSHKHRSVALASVPSRRPDVVPLTARGRLFEAASRRPWPNSIRAAAWPDPRSSPAWPFPATSVPAPLAPPAASHKAVAREDSVR